MCSITWQDVQYRRRCAVSEKVCNIGEGVQCREKDIAQGIQCRKNVFSNWRGISAVIE